MGSQNDDYLQILASSQTFSQIENFKWDCRSKYAAARLDLWDMKSANIDALSQHAQTKLLEINLEDTFGDDTFVKSAAKSI